MVYEMYNQIEISIANVFAYNVELRATGYSRIHKTYAILVESIRLVEKKMC
jgi:hypothetical protein